MTRLCPECHNPMAAVDFDPGDSVTPPTPAEWFCVDCGIAEPICTVCNGTGANPLSDNLNWLPCSQCGGSGKANP